VDTVFYPVQNAGAPATQRLRSFSPACYVSTAPEKAAGVPPNVTIYPVKVTYQLPSLPGSDPQQTVARNVYENVYEELVCD
ncbi:hypothetical protein ACW73L_04425, partial [Methylolobus aquaticus]